MANITSGFPPQKHVGLVYSEIQMIIIIIIIIIVIIIIQELYENNNKTNRARQLFLSIFLIFSIRTT